MKKVSIPFIAIYLIGTLLIIGAFENIGLLYNLDLIDSIIHRGQVDGLQKYAEQNKVSEGSVLTTLLYSTHLIPQIGLLIAVALAILIARKRNISLVNPTILLILGFLLIRFDYSKFLQFPHLFSRIDVSLIVSSILLILTGAFIFFSRWTNNLVRHNP